VSLPKLAHFSVHDVSSPGYNRDVIGNGDKTSMNTEETIYTMTS